MKLELIKTGDGSHSLFREDINETYHSTHGAIAESRHVYIDMGLKKVLEKGLKVNILEVGFGTGLNALLTLEYHYHHPISIRYHTLEPYPLKEEVYAKINHPEGVVYEGSREDFIQMHVLKDGESHAFREGFSFVKHLQKLEDFISEEKFTVIYFDAFAPNKQADMWGKEQFERLYALLEKGGVLTTYCAQGQFKRTLKEVGFEVLEMPGPPGKKQMTVAVK